jgi:hypothetical protein
MILGDTEDKSDLLTTLSHIGNISVGNSFVQKMQDVIRCVSAGEGAQMRYVLSFIQMKPPSLNALCFRPKIPCACVSTICRSVNFANSCSDTLPPWSDKISDNPAPYLSNPIQTACFLHFDPVFFAFLIADL